MKKLCIYLAMATLLIACAKTNEETESLKAKPDSGVTSAGCDTIGMKYSTNVLPILQANCYSCHAGGQAEAGVSLGSYIGVKQQVNNNNLLRAITHAGGVVPMPYNLPKLSDCNINKIKDWIANGSLNN